MQYLRPDPLCGLTMPPIEFRFDRISFWLGFLAASLVWWLFSRVRPYLPLWREQVRRAWRAFSQRNLAAVEDQLRRETLRQAQRQHLAAPIFALDEILVQPWLLLPPESQNSSTPSNQLPIAGQILPYLPDWPELVASYSVPRITPAQALQSGRHIAIIGQPGAGKTVALAHLASQVARHDAVLGSYAAAVPLFMHVLDLDLQLPEGQDPLQNLTRAVTSKVSVVMQPQVARTIRTIFRDRQRLIVLLLDGLDELPIVDFQAATTYLSSLLQKYPQLQVVTTASPDYLGDLTQAHFLPLSLTGWSTTQRSQFTRRWGELWTTQLLPEIKKHTQFSPLEPVLIENWLAAETGYSSPLEWTLRVWGAHTGDLQGGNLLDTLLAHIVRFLPEPAFLTALQEIARQMVMNQTASLTFGEMERLLSESKIASQSGALDQSSSPDPQSDQGPSGGNPKKPPKKSRRELTASQGETILAGLIQGGILVEHAGDRLSFSSPVLLGLLAGLHVTPEDCEKLVQNLEWPVNTQTLQFAAAISNHPAWVNSLLAEDSAPLHWPLLLIARWLHPAPQDANWRGTVMRKLVTTLQEIDLPFSMMARVIAAFYQSRDPSIEKLFHQLLGSRSQLIRRAALLGCGAVGAPALFNDLVTHLADAQSEVRETACLAIAAIPGEAALKALVEILLSGDEEIRQAAAESLVLNQSDGYKVLEEAAFTDDLLARRAAVFGLSRIGENWAREVLEKMAVEDGQWVVRSAAAEALEALQKNSPALPALPPKPSEAGWLITFASKLGMGIQPDQPATDVLLMVLKSGSIEEQIAALQYLREQPDEAVVGEIYHLLTGKMPEVQEAALQAFWWLKISGRKLPALTVFKLNYPAY